MYFGGHAEREPLMMNNNQPMLHAGAQAAIASMAALRWARMTGEGQHIDVSSVEAMLSAHAWTSTSWTHEGVVLRRTEPDCIPCKDGWVWFFPFRWDPTFFILIDRPELIDHEDFADRQSWADNRDKTGYPADRVVRRQDQRRDIQGRTGTAGPGYSGKRCRRPVEFVPASVPGVVPASRSPHGGQNGFAGLPLSVFEKHQRASGVPRQRSVKTPSSNLSPRNRPFHAIGREKIVPLGLDSHQARTPNWGTSPGANRKLGWSSGGEAPRRPRGRGHQDRGARSTGHARRAISRRRPIQASLQPRRLLQQAEPQQARDYAQPG